MTDKRTFLRLFDFALAESRKMALIDPDQKIRHISLSTHYKAYARQMSVFSFGCSILRFLSLRRGCLTHLPPPRSVLLFVLFQRFYLSARPPIPYLLAACLCVLRFCYSYSYGSCFFMAY